MRHIVDTSVLIDHLKGDERARAVLVAAFGDGAVLGSVPTRTEVIAGMRDKERRSTMALLDSVQWIEVDADLADRAGELARAYLRSHPGIDAVDYLIAATTIREGAELLTRNVKHFPMFEGLAAPY